MYEKCAHWCQRAHASFVDSVGGYEATLDGHAKASFAYTREKAGSDNITRIDRCGETDKQFIVKLFLTGILYELNVLVQIASRLFFWFAKMDEADWVALLARLFFERVRRSPHWTGVAELERGFFGHWIKLGNRGTLDPNSSRLR